MLEALARGAFERDVALIDARAAAARGWEVKTVVYPVLDIVFTHPVAKPLRLKFTCEDWDDRPPSIGLLEADGTPLLTKPQNTDGQFHPGGHPNTGRPFVCMRGALEYHTHPQHAADVWDNYRGRPGMDLGGIVFQLWRVWRRSVG